MKGFVLFGLALLTVVGAKPNGMYHQQYNYRTSSSSYRNNELQHQNQDEGFYSKDGDLEGRFRPKINSHNQHAEYVNPKLQNGMYGESATSSFGHLNSQNHLMNAGHLENLRDTGAYGGFGGSSFQSGSSYQNYGMSSNLRQITHSLEQQLARQLQDAIYNQHSRSSSYSSSLNSHQIEADMRLLEEELRRNVSMGIQEALRSRYGNQGMRGGLSYSLLNGRLQSTANYDNQELADLTRQIETNLLRQLEQGVRTQYHTSSHMTSMNTASSGGNTGYYPVNVQEKPNYGPVISNPDSLTTIATRVQNDLNEHLNRILEDTQRRYFASGSSHSYQTQNWDSILMNLQQELRSNITHQFELQMRNNYGSRANYNIQDLENLKKQIENNLISKLSRDFNTQKERFFRTVSVSGGASTQQYFDNRPVYHSNQYNNYAGAMNQADWSSMQRTLQEDLSRQLQAALMQQQFRQSHAYGGSTYNTQANYQAALQQLTAELNRNLTRQLEHSLSQYQGAQSYSRGNYENQMAMLRSQLQDNLLRELQQGLQQSYSRYSSWSSAASSSSSNYRPVRGFDSGSYHNYGGAAGLNVGGEDCMMGDDPSTYQQVENDDLTQQTEDLTQHLENEDMTQQVVNPSEPEESLVSTRRTYVTGHGNPQTVGRQSGAETRIRQHYYQPQQTVYRSQISYTSPSVVSRKYYVTDSNGRRREVDENEFREELKSFKTTPSTSRYLHRYYVTDTSGHDTEIHPDQEGEIERFFQANIRNLENQAGQSVSHVTRRYYVTDSTGRRSEVSEDQFQKQMENFRNTPSTTRTTHHYYVTDNAGHNTEINPNQRENFQKLLQQWRDRDSASSTGNIQINRKYYITDGSGQRQELSEIQFRKYIENARSSPSTIYRYYITDSSGNNVEINPNEKGQFEKVLQGATTTTSTVRVTRKYYIRESNGERKEVSEAEFQKYLENAKSSPGTTRTIRRYYTTDSSGRNIEINPNENGQFQKLFQQTQTGTQLGTSTVSRKYYITDVNGQRNEVSEAQFQKYIENARSSPGTTRTVYKYYVTDGSGQNIEVNPNQEGQWERIFQQKLTGSQLGTSIVSRKYYITDVTGHRQELSEAQFQKYIENARSSPGTTRTIYKYYVTDGSGQNIEINPNQEGEWERIVGQKSNQFSTSTVSRKYYITDVTGHRQEVNEAQFQKYIENARSSPGTTRTIYKYYVTDGSGDIEINPNEEGQWERVLQQQLSQVVRRYYVTDSHGRRQEIDADQFRRELEEPGTTRILRRYYVTDSSGHRTEVFPGQEGIDDIVEKAITETEELSQKNQPNNQIGSSLNRENVGYGKLYSGNHLDQTDDSDLTQQTEDVGFGKLGTGQQVETGQHPDDPDLTQQTEDLGSGKLQTGHQLGQQQVELGQHPDDSDLTQQTEDVGYGKLQTGHQLGQQQVELGQHPDDSDLTQQTEDLGYGKLQTGHQLGQQQIELGQHPDDSDLTQQTEDVGYGKLQTGHQLGQQQVELGQHPDDSDLTQQTEDLGYGKLQTGHQLGQQQIELGQHPDDSDLTQQTEDVGYGKLQTGHQLGQQQVELGQHPDDSDLTQQTEDVGYGKLQTGHQLGQQQVELARHPYDSDLTQQTENLGSGKLQTGHQLGQQQVELGQHPDDSDLTQQTEDLGYSKLQTGHQLGQQQVELGQHPDDSDLTQQTEDVGFGKLQAGQQQVEMGQHPDDSDLTQQTEVDDFGRLQTGSHPGQRLVEMGQRPDDSKLTQQSQISIHRTPEVHYNQQQSYKPLHSSPQTSQLNNYQHRNGQFRVGTLELGSYGRKPTPQTPTQNYLGQSTGSYGRKPERISQDIEDTTDQTEDLTQQSQDLTHQPHSGQHQTELGQETEDLGLTQQQVDVDFGPLSTGSQSGQPQRTVNQVVGRPLGQRRDDYVDFDAQQNVEDQHLQQQAGLYRQKQHDLTQQVEDSHIAQQSQYGGGYRKPTRLNQVEQPIEPQVSTNTIFKSSEQPEGINQQSQVTDLDDPYQTSDMLLEKLRQKVQANHQSKPSYGDVHFGSQQEIPVETTGSLGSGNSGYYSRSHGSQSSSYGSQNSYQSGLHYGSSQQIPVETANSFETEPIASQHAGVIEAGIKGKINVASEVEEVITTTEAAGFWSKLGSKVKSKAQSIKEKLG